MNTLQILKAARAKIENPENWTKYTEARDAFGMPVEPDNDDARCWSVSGAVMAIVRNNDHAERIARVICGANGRSDLLTTMHDFFTFQHHSALFAFDRAIAAEEAKAVQS